MSLATTTTITNTLIPSALPNLILDQPQEADLTIVPSTSKKTSRKIQHSRKSKKNRYQPTPPLSEKTKNKLDAAHTKLDSLQMKLAAIETKLESLQEITKCIICYESMYRPTTLPCGHTACSACCLNIITYLPIGTQPNVARKCALCRSPYLSAFTFGLNDKVREMIITLHGEEAYITRGIQQMDDQISFIHIQPHELSLPPNMTRFLKIIAYLLSKYVLAFYTAEEVIKAWKMIIDYFNLYLPNWSVFTTDNILFHSARQLKLNILEDPRALKYMIVIFPETNLVYPDIPDRKLLDIFWNSFPLNKHAAKVMYV